MTKLAKAPRAQTRRPRHLDKIGLDRVFWLLDLGHDEAGPCHALALATKAEIEIDGEPLHPVFVDQGHAPETVQSLGSIHPIRQIPSNNKNIPLPPTVLVYPAIPQTCDLTWAG